MNSTWPKYIELLTFYCISVNIYEAKYSLNYEVESYDISLIYDLKMAEPQKDLPPTSSLATGW